MGVMPWETPVPAVVEPPQTPVTVQEGLQALQRDFAYAVANTAVQVHSRHEALQVVVNTPRGQIIPRGECKLSDGSTIELQDIGMPQVGAPLMTVPELVKLVMETVADLGLGVAS